MTLTTLELKVSLDVRRNEAAETHAPGTHGNPKRTAIGVCIRRYRRLVPHRPQHHLVKRDPPILSLPL